jgi:hypothetical protein
MFAPNDNVYVDINPQFDPTQTSQITTALDRWSYANTHNNTSGVVFTVRVLNQIPAGAILLHISFAALTDQYGIPDYTVRSYFRPIQHSGIYITEAQIIFNTNAAADGFDPSQPFFDPQSPGYESIYIKLGEHEIGHGMGLDHPPSSAQ